MRYENSIPNRRPRRVFAPLAVAVLGAATFLVSTSPAGGATFVGTPDLLWPDGYIPYQFSDDFAGAKANVRAAMDEWESVANLTFEECSDCCTTPIIQSILGNSSCNSDASFGDCSDPPFLFIMNDSSNHSEIGANGNNCRGDCTVCGDGITNDGELCDDGNGIDDDACPNDCGLMDVCGDGVIDTGSGGVRITSQR